MTASKSGKADSQTEIIVSDPSSGFKDCFKD